MLFWAIPPPKTSGVVHYYACRVGLPYFPSRCVIWIAPCFEHGLNILRLVSNEQHAIKSSDVPFQDIVFQDIVQIVSLWTLLNHRCNTWYVNNMSGHYHTLWRHYWRKISIWSLHHRHVRVSECRIGFIYRTIFFERPEKILQYLRSTAYYNIFSLCEWSHERLLIFGDLIN